MKKTAINGLGRIGRATLKILLGNPEFELVAVNDLVPVENIAYLLKYDTVYGRYDKEIKVEDGNLVIGGRKIRTLHEKEPDKLPWRELNIHTVFECTGVFTKKGDLDKHVIAGAEKVILSAPSKSEEVVTVVYGVDNSKSTPKVISCASCTTNCITPVVEIMGRNIGIKKAIMTTIHAYTASQGIVDGPASKYRRGRAGAANMVPTSTGAAIATTKVLPEFKGIFNGVAVRVPVPVGSLADLVFVTKKPVTVEEINDMFRKEASGGKYKNVIGVSEDPIVSSDVIRDPRASVIDLTMTQVVDGDLVKIMSWYDNEWGYANQMVREATL